MPWFNKCTWHRVKSWNAISLLSGSKNGNSRVYRHQTKCDKQCKYKKSAAVNVVFLCSNKYTTRSVGQQVRFSSRTSCFTLIEKFGKLLFCATHTQMHAPLYLKRRHFFICLYNQFSNERPSYRMHFCFVSSTLRTLQFSNWDYPILRVFCTADFKIWGGPFFIPQKLWFGLKCNQLLERNDFDIKSFISLSFQVSPADTSPIRAGRITHPWLNWGLSAAERNDGPNCQTA